MSEAVAFGDLQARLRDAREPLRFIGHGSKDFYGEAPQGEVVSTLGLTGVTAYEPSELYISVLAGTLNPGKQIPSLSRCAEYGRMHVKRGLLAFPELERF